MKITDVTEATSGKRKALSVNDLRGPRARKALQMNDLQTARILPPSI